MNLDQRTQPTVRERLEFALLGLPICLLAPVLMRWLT
jgi:hypothetical protein